MFDVREFMAEQTLEPFPFKDRDGKPWELPHIGLMSAADADELLSGNFAEVIGRYSKPGTAEAFVGTPSVALAPLSRAWFEHCGIEIDDNGQMKPGKSSPFSQPSPSTAAQSRRTSASAASKTRKR